MKLICETCREWIGTFDPEAVKLPLVSEMFKAVREAASHHPPFRAGLTAEWFRCPVCNKKPFHLPDRLLTDDGHVIVLPEPAACDHNPVAAKEEPPAPVEMVEPEIVGEVLTEPPAAKYVCKVCGRSFTKSIALVGHKRSHK